LPESIGPRPPLLNQAGRWSRFLGLLRNRPVLCLFLMTPGFPEYLSGSSSFTAIVLNPPFFFLQLAINAAMYLPGALLVREAALRWNKGWPTVFVLGAAYAIMEEGIADQTILNPHMTPIGSAGFYGHFLGVNWLWLPDVLLIHILFSIAIPITLLGYALPEYRGKSLLSNRGIGAALVIISIDTAVLTVLVSVTTRYWYGLPLLLACLLAILALSGLGYVLPKFLFTTRTGGPDRTPLAFFFVGFVIYPLMLVVEAVGASRGVLPGLVLLGVIAVPVVLFAWFVRHIGSQENARHFVAFAGGSLVVIMAIGVATEIYFPIVLVADFATWHFFRWLYRTAGDRSSDFEHKNTANPSAAA
jgi:hypothetical protein